MYTQKLLVKPRDKVSEFSNGGRKRSQARAREREKKVEANTRQKKIKQNEMKWRGEDLLNLTVLCREWLLAHMSLVG